MTALWTGNAIAAATGGQLSGEFAVTGVAFDSREIMGGELFIALRGSETDGHKFIKMAIEREASGVLCERPTQHPHVLVPDSFAALQQLGHAARKRTDATIIGVTGSVGKTGTKEALRRAFQRMAPHHTHWSVKSYNNQTGVPLSLARMRADTRYGVFEMGMSSPGEIREHTKMVRPHVAIITWVASAHLAYFENERAIAKAKTEIFEGVEPGGTAIWPRDNPHAEILAQAVVHNQLQSLSFGLSAKADVRALEVEAEPDGSQVVADVAGETLHYRIGMPGRHWVSNSLAVIAAVKAAGGDIAEAGLALAELTELPGRGGRFAVSCPGGEAYVIDESYNANPTSMAAALAVLRDTPAKRRLAVLGDMRELGDSSAEQHAALQIPVADADLAEIALVGEEMRALEMEGVTHLPDTNAAISWVQSTLAAGDVLLVKGSNGVGLGRLVEQLRGAS